VKVLVLNAGSSSMKFTLFEMSETAEEWVAKGAVERIGQDAPTYKYETQTGCKKAESAGQLKNHGDAMELVCSLLADSNCGVISDVSEVSAIGHRIVHGAEEFTQSQMIDARVKEKIEACFPLAPLHNPPNLGGVLACEERFPGTPNVAVFDTAFHQTMPAYTYRYPVTDELYEKDGVRKYGFHGTSHRFVSQAAAKYLDKPLEELKLITCHLGNGASIAAVDGGKVLDTSMGMTPLAGLMMGTRCGDIDPGVILHLIKTGYTVDEVDTMLNKKSGVLAMAGIGSSDMRDLNSAIDEGNEKAKQAMDMYVYRVAFYIGAYFTALGGADAVIFTGGVGEYSIPTRGWIVKRLKALGCHLDPKANEAAFGVAGTVSTPDSTLKALVLPTDEELMIARDTRDVINAG
jgi:acetate kinase